MVDSQPKHKPNEKHTLDEVLKSLKDLVRNEVLDKASAPPTETAPAAAPPPGAAAIPSMGMSEIISSLEDLLDTDLTFEDKQKPAITAAPSPPPEPAPTPPEEVAADIAPAAPAPEIDDEVDIDMTAADALVPTPQFPEEMSDEDIAKALADIELEMGIEAVPVPQAEPEFLDPADEAPVPAAPAPSEEAPAPALELTVQEPPAETPEQEQGELPLTAFKRPALETDDTAPSADNAPDDAFEEEIAAAPPPAEPVSEEPEAIELASIPADPDATLEPAPPQPIDDDFTIDFAPRDPQAQPAAAPADDDLAPPPWEDDGTLERAEPPVQSGSHESALGASIELDISGSWGTDPEPAPSAPAEPESAPLPITETVEPAAATPKEPAPTAAPTAAHAVPTTEVIEPVVEIIEAETEVIEMAPDTLVPRPVGEIPVLKDIAVEGRTEAGTPPTETFKLELTPTAPPTPPATRPASVPHNLHQVAVRAIAQLNIELRKAGKPPLDAKTINRLQQLLKEALDRKGNEK